MTAHTESGGRSRTARLTLAMMREKRLRPDISLCDETDVFLTGFALRVRFQNLVMMLKVWRESNNQVGSYFKAF